jgi:hypothetical protein
MGAVSTGNAQHHQWGDACDGWHLLAADDLSVVEERMPPGAVEQRHRDRIDAPLVEHAR